MKPHLLGLIYVMLITTCPLAASGEAMCQGVSSSGYALDISSKLESTSEPSFLRAVYDREFTVPFKMRFSFGEFYRDLTAIHRRLTIGPNGTRALQSRALNSPEVVATWSNTSGPVRPTQSLGIGQQMGDLVDVEFFTTSSVGKIRQKLQIACLPDGWRVNGIWYFPSGSK